MKALAIGRLDKVVSSRGGGKGCLATSLERKTRFYLIFKTPDRTAKSLLSVIEQFTSLFLKTLSSDTGKEFASYPFVE